MHTWRVPPENWHYKCNNNPINIHTATIHLVRGTNVFRATIVSPGETPTFLASCVSSGVTPTFRALQSCLRKTPTFRAPHPATMCGGRRAVWLWETPYTTISVFPAVHITGTSLYQLGRVSPYDYEVSPPHSGLHLCETCRNRLTILIYIGNRSSALPLVRMIDILSFRITLLNLSEQ